MEIVEIDAPAAKSTPASATSEPVIATLFGLWFEFRWHNCSFQLLFDIHVDESFAICFTQLRKQLKPNQRPDFAYHSLPSSSSVPLSSSSSSLSSSSSSSSSSAASSRSSYRFHDVLDHDIDHGVDELDPITAYELARARAQQERAERYRRRYGSSSSSSYQDDDGGKVDADEDDGGDEDYAEVGRRGRQRRRVRDGASHDKIVFLSSVFEKEV